MRNKSGAVVGPLMLMCAVACATAEDDKIQADLQTPEQGPGESWTARTGEAVLARVDGPHGGSVQWTLDEGGEVAVEIDAVYPHPILIAPDFVDAHGPLAAWIVLSPEGAELPEALVDAVPPEEFVRVHDATLIAKLRLEHDARLTEVVTSAPQGAFATSQAALTTGCTTSFRNWVRSSYGNGYGTNATCGNSATEWPGSRNRDFYYCNLTGQDCDYSLGSVDAFSCSPALQTCHAVRGRRVSSVARVNETNGNPTFVQSGHRYRFGVANCSGNGDLLMRRRAAGGSTIDTPVPVGHMEIRVGGTATIDARATAISNVAFGGWDNDINSSDSGWKQYTFWLDDNTATNDRAIFCVDLQQQLQMTDISSCFGSDLCPAGHSCTGSCYD